MTSSSSCTEEDLLVVAQMNQYGMQAMEQCRTTDASWILRHTIGYWMMQPTRTKEAPWQTDEAHRRRSPSTSPPCSPLAAFSFSTLQMRPMTYELREAVQRHRHIYEKLPISLYTKAFFIYPCAMPRNVVTALLWYNHGLCCHMHGLTQGNATGALQEALQFYHHAYQIVLSECATSFSECGLLRKHDPSIINNDSLVVQQYLCLVAAAVCHNMALLYHYAFGHMAAARSLRCQLLHWIQTTSDGDGVFFHLGLFLARMDDFRLAPAA